MPLTFDMPMEELRDYRGTNPKPADFDAYWDAALAELNTVDPKVKIVPDVVFQLPTVSCSHLWFTGVGGTRIHAKLFKPRNPTEAHPAVLRFHGYSRSSGDWTVGETLALVASGFTVAALDCLGQSGLSEEVGGLMGTTLRGHIVRGVQDAPEKLMYRSVFLDAVQLARIVMEMDDVDASRVGAMGGSQGGALALACAALEPRIKKVASMSPFLSDYQRVWEMDLAEGFYGELKEFFRQHDPQHYRENEIFMRLGYIDIKNLMRWVEAEVMMGIGLMDTTCPPSTQFAAYNRILSKKSLEIYPDFGHEILPEFWDKACLMMLEL